MSSGRADEPLEPDAWDRTAAWLANHGALPALGVLAIAMLALYGQLFAGEVDGDDLTFHFAESVRIADCLRQGDWDFWNPNANGGYPSAYFYQVIPQLASALPAALFGDHLFWFQLSVVLPHVLTPLGAYRGMRLMGASPWQSVCAAIVVSFMNGQSRWGAGNAGTFEVGLYTQTWALAAFPVAIGHAMQWVTHQRGLAPAIAWGAFVFLCHPFIGIAIGVVLVGAFVAQCVLHVLDLARRGRPGFASSRRAGKRPPRPLRGQLVRSFVLGIALLVSWMPIWLPLLGALADTLPIPDGLARDWAAFGGFPHRVADEVGPGFKLLGRWFVDGWLFDFERSVAIVSYSLLAVLALARAPYLRWLWAPSLVFALLLGIGPSAGKTSGDDLFPAARFLGAMQTLLALGVGAGLFDIGRRMWNAPEGSWLHAPFRWVVVGAGKLVNRETWAREVPLQYSFRTAVASLIAVWLVMIAVAGWPPLDRRLLVLRDPMRAELFEMNAVLAKQPPGRKQVEGHATHHWWNLLSYAYDRRPALLQLGGGGLQASPNYDLIWHTADFGAKAWIYDAPYVIVSNDKASSIPGGETIAKTNNYELRRLPSPGLVSPVQVTGILPPGPSRPHTPTRNAVIAWMQSDHARNDRVLAYAGDGGNTNPPAARVLRAVRQPSPGDEPDIVAEVEVDKPTTFVVRESWHPRWHAYIDGREVPIRRVTPDFPAIDVPPGRHVLTFRFLRPWWLDVAWLAWPLTVLAAWLATRKRRMN